MATLEPQQDKIVEDAMAGDTLPSEKPTGVEETGTEPQQPSPKKRNWVETLLLCIALFFPLFLATLDTSNLDPPALTSHVAMLIVQPLLLPLSHVTCRDVPPVLTPSRHCVLLS
jgi:hypothetical protein